MKKIRIALFGAHINSSNLGCQALTYSLLNLLNAISAEKAIVIEFYVFEYSPNKYMTNKVSQQLGIDESLITSFPIAPIYRTRSFIKHFREDVRMLQRIQLCDLAIDLTAGDSFSDIYGNDRFVTNTRIKRIVELMGVPLVLGPQTIGPFLNSDNTELARKVLTKAYRAIARDEESSQLASKLSGKRIPFTTDLAFQLPYIKRWNSSERVSVGLNISGLLVSNHIEKGIENTIKLKTDYDYYINSLLDYLCKDYRYEVTLVSHVKEDFEACKRFRLLYPSAQLAPLFDNPIDIKSYISGFDVFIGGRMHATIAAFTSGVVTIPTAYSRKFSGLFSVVDYRRIIDLQMLSTSEAVDETLKIIEDWSNVRSELEASINESRRYEKVTKDFFIDAINDIL